MKRLIIIIIVFLSILSFVLLSRLKSYSGYIKNDSTLCLNKTGCNHEQLRGVCQPGGKCIN